jgi:hypothetical protein
MSYLLTCRIFVEERPSDDLMIQRMLHGCHNLHFYAHEFWARHLINYLDVSSLERRSCDVWTEIEVLLADLQCYENPGNLPAYDAFFAANQKTFTKFFPASTLNSLRKIEGNYGLVEKFSIFRKMLNEHSLSQRDAAGETLSISFPLISFSLFDKFRLPLSARYST